MTKRKGKRAEYKYNVRLNSHIHCGHCGRLDSIVRITRRKKISVGAAMDRIHIEDACIWCEWGRLVATYPDEAVGAIRYKREEWLRKRREAQTPISD